MKRRLIPVLMLAVVVATAWGVIVLAAPDPRGQQADAEILAAIGSAFVIGVVVQLVGTSGWNLRGLGLLATMAGDASLYGNTALNRHGWRGPIGRNGVDLVLSLLLVGGTLLVVGLIWWAIGTRFGTRPQSPEREPNHIQP